jgi:hypothetical protein
MNTQLTDQVLELTSQLYSLQFRKQNAQKRIETLQDKLAMAMQVGKQLEKEEGELVTKLHAEGFYYGTPSPESIIDTPLLDNTSMTEMLQTNDQLTAFLSTLINQASISPEVAMAGASAALPATFANRNRAENEPAIPALPVTIGYNFPQVPGPVSLGQQPIGVTQLEPITAVPKSDPGSGPRLSIRKRG